MAKPIPKDKWIAEQNSNVIPVNEYRVMSLKKSGAKNKYKAKKQSYNGVKYDSTLEAKVAENLDWKLKEGELVEVQRQVKIPLYVNGVLICTYICDFKTIDKHGQVTYVEAKGIELPVFQIKKKLFLALLESIDSGAKYEIIKA